MLLIPCPWCGARAHSEFKYGGDAGQRRSPDPAKCTSDAWLDYVYLRDNPHGVHREWWHHSAGCRQWIQVVRDTATHEVMGAWDATSDVQVSSLSKRG